MLKTPQNPSSDSVTSKIHGFLGKYEKQSYSYDVNVYTHELAIKFLRKHLIKHIDTV